MTIDNENTEAKAVELPARIRSALEAAGCPDIERVAKAFAVLQEHGKAISALPLGSKAHVAYERACVRVSSRLLATEAWGETDTAAIETEVKAFSKG